MSIAARYGNGGGRYAPDSGGWGYYPTGGVGLLLVIVIVLLVAGRI